MFLLVFCLIDDLCREGVPERVCLRSQHRRIQFSDAEVLTLSVVQEALSNDSERSFHRFIEKNYLHLFPKLLARDRYHRRRKALWKVQELLFLHLAKRLSQEVRWLVVDSAPVETAKFARSQSARRSIPEAEYGFIPSEKRVFFGLRLHALVTDRGVMASFVLSPANGPEREAAEEMLADHAGQAVLADNGFGRQRILWNTDGRGRRAARTHDLGQSEAEPKTYLAGRGERPALASGQARPDPGSVFGVLSDQFKVERTRARSLWGAGTRIVAKLLSFNLSILLNQMLGRPDLAIKSLYL